MQMFDLFSHGGRVPHKVHMRETANSTVLGKPHAQKR
jgi:hypothetical protein